MALVIRHHLNSSKFEPINNNLINTQQAKTIYTFHFDSIQYINQSSIFPNVYCNLLFVNVSDMPCWYFDKKEIRNTPSHRDAIDPSTEARYRREGARFIIDAGTKMGLYPFNL